MTRMPICSVTVTFANAIGLVWSMQMLLGQILTLMMMMIISMAQEKTGIALHTFIHVFVRMLNRMGGSKHV